MASNDMSGTPGEGGIRRKPSYSEVLKATPGGAIDTSATATSGFWSAGNASLGTGLTAPTPLFSPSIWSPLQQDTRSATIPRKLSWETTVNTKANGMSTNTPPQDRATGLGLQFGDAKAANGKHANTPVIKDNRETTTPGHSNLASNSTPYKYKQQDIAHAQAKPFIHTGGVQLPKTAPLVQQPFYGSSGIPGVHVTPSNSAGLEVTATAHPLSRAICIKTDFVENIHWAIQHSMWGVMEKVAARIMTLWEAKTGGKDKIILIFSVNGQKSYCGLAEMSGPWKKAEGEIEGFKIKKDGLSRAWGTMPITWIFIKNVSYYWFRDIKNPHNDQDVVNMWNGMHFPCDIAREVVEIIIKRPHFTNVLAWREDMSYDPFKPVLDAQQIDPLAGDGKKMNAAMRMIENGRPGGHGRKGQALAVMNWRQPQEQNEEAAHASVAGSIHRQGTANPTMTSTTPPNLDGHSSPHTRYGQLVTCYIDEDGNFVPVTPSGNMSKAPVASSNHSLIDLDTPRGVSPAFNQRGGLNNTPGRGGLINYRGGRGGKVTARGNFNVVNNPRGPTRVATTPHHARTLQPFAGFVGPQLRRMKSDFGLEDPFGNPRMPVQTSAMPRVMQQGTNAHPTSNNQTATFQRAVGSANFVPQNLGGPATTATSATHSFGASASYGNATPQPHAPAHSGGVMLAPEPSYHTVEITPSRLRGQGSVKQDTANQTAVGYSIYPGPTDRTQAKSPTEKVVQSKSDKGPADAKKLKLQYLDRLRHQAAIETEMMGIKLEEAGITVPEYLKKAGAVNAKGD